MGGSARFIFEDLNRSRGFVGSEEELFEAIFTNGLDFIFLFGCLFIAL